MSTSTGESDTIKSSSSLSSTDLVSRFLAATPSYLYNVSTIQHNFFFSEMLRSFLPNKNDTFPINNNGVRRRKRSWKESRDRPLELTTNKRNILQYQSISKGSNPNCQLHYQQALNNQEQNNQQYPLFLQHQNRSYKRCLQNSITEIQNKKHDQTINDEIIKCISQRNSDDITNIDEMDIQPKSESINKYFPVRLPSNSPKEPLLYSDTDKIVPDGLQNVENRTNYTDSTFSQYCASSPTDNTKNIFSNSAGSDNDLHLTSNFRLPMSSSPEILQSPLWYSPYTLSQTYPAIDPLHFYIDLRVSGHIWDPKTNEKNSVSRNKHNSAFSVPQSKECNRPLNLTRMNLPTIKPVNENIKGTHHIFKNIKQTYRRIWDSEYVIRNNKMNTDYDDTTEIPKPQIISDKPPEMNSIALNGDNEKQ